MTDPANLRADYQRDRLLEGDAPDSWYPLLRAWFDAAAGDAAVLEANAIQLATADAAGRPSVRTVLAKGIQTDGVVFFTNYDSGKAHDLDVNPVASLVFVWLAHQRQVRLSGTVGKIERRETDEYFASRPRGSQLGAWASPQSQVVASRAELDELVAATQARFGDGDIPAPPGWGGYRLTPDTVEFWQGRPDRVHDRLRYRLDGADWVRERLAP